MTVEVGAIFRLRRDTAANWASVNPVLRLAEPGLETDTRKVKYGDGSTAWNSLPYAAIPSAALTKTDDTNVTLTLGGSPTIALLAAASLTLGWTGTLAPGRGGTGLGSYNQGDLIYASASNTLAALAKNTSSTRYLSNTGTSNAPAWAQVDLTNGVAGILPAANGGTGIAYFTVSGPTAARTFTFPDASDTVACLAQVNAFTQRVSITNSTASQTALAATGVSNARILIDFQGGGANLYDATTHSFRPIGGASNFLSMTATAANFTLDIQRGGTKVVGTRKTGWGTATGTAARTTYATYASPTISNPPTQAEVQALADHVQILSQRLKALIDDLHGTAGHGLIGT